MPERSSCGISKCGAKFKAAPDSAQTSGRVASSGGAAAFDKNDAASSNDLSGAFSTAQMEAAHSKLVSYTASKTGSAPTPPRSNFDDQCCLAAARNPNVVMGHAGGVICCDNQKVACAWNSDIGDPEIRAIKDECGLRHENVHLPVCIVGDGCGPGRIARLGLPSELYEQSECDAYLVGINCLEELAGSCSNQSCYNKIMGVAKVHKEYRADFCQRAANKSNTY